MTASAVVMVVVMVPVILLSSDGRRFMRARRSVEPRTRRSPTQIPRTRLSRYRLPLGVVGVRAGAVRAGRLHRPPDLVPRFVIGPAAGGDCGGAVDGDGGGRPRAVFLRDRPDESAAGVRALFVSQAIALLVVINVIMITC
jgi:hypothetical protein